jgi:hypothetical protein
MGEYQRPAYGPKCEASAARLAFEADKDNDQDTYGQESRDFFDDTHSRLLLGGVIRFYW